MGNKKKATPPSKFLVGGSIGLLIPRLTLDNRLAYAPPQSQAGKGRGHDE